ncbi:MAG: gliding motility-associated C-terminal domain-containing protein [Bacteroidales bacterium]|jgi:hypothetical protein|nr:gliding motility-associated C-terminal domain-containing protein [Bacteroidales bacterium]
MRAYLFRDSKLLITCLLLFAAVSVSLYPQTRINGIINEYGRVTSTGNDYVILSNSTQVSYFAAGDTVLLIQMKGGVSIIDENSNFGLPQDTIGAPGKYEFLIVSTTIPAEFRVNFRNDMVNSFSSRGNLQLIRVPSFNSALVDGILTCEPWDSISGTGGVMAMIVERSLMLDADIDVSGKGFAGGSVSTGDGLCVMSDETLYGKFGFPVSFNNSGMKGESQITLGLLNLTEEYPLIPGYAKGKGNNFTGGGGGNGRFSGGGGGSNYGAGGKGGMEYNLCESYPVDGGMGGRQVLNSNMSGGIFPGGGGGSSTYLQGATASAGGQGGGIIIILCDTLIGNGHSIRADGAAAGNASVNAGAGGGGGGGSVAVHTESFSKYTPPVSSINITANGGKGGNNAGSYGEGGGGGGGLIWLRNTSLPSGVTATAGGGSPGTRLGSPTGLAGNSGQTTTFKPVLTGFLYNSIRSSVTGNQVDSICSNLVPVRLTGTNPVGGTPPYNYRWQRSYNLESWETLYDGPDSINFTPAFAETANVYFRRIVTDSEIPALEDVGKPVLIIVHQYIKNNLIGYPDTLCYEQVPDEIASTATVYDGNGIYNFIWESSTDSITFITASSGSENYQYPSGLEQTTWFRRIVTSARCIDTSLAVRINVLDPIGNNSIITPSQEICEGMIFENITATEPPDLTGGDGVYRYLWQSSSDGQIWENATAANDQPDYDPTENIQPYPSRLSYKRLVFSGSDDVCQSESNVVLLTKYPSLTDNLITSGDQTICSGSAPLELTGSEPSGGMGAGSYTYTWQDSSGNHDWTDIVGFTGVDDQSYIPSALTDSTRYRRIVNSSVCSDTSLPVSIHVHKTVLNNIITLRGGGLTDTVICSGATPTPLTGLLPAGGTEIPGNYTFQWFSSPDNMEWTEIPGSEGSIGYTPPPLTSTTYYIRRVVSGECVSESDPLKIEVLPVITGNIISGPQVVCRNIVTGPLIQSPGSSLSGGAGSGSYAFLWEESTDGISWDPAEGINNSADGSYQPPALNEARQYRRIVTSGPASCCSDISNILEIAIETLPEGMTISAGNDTTLYLFDLITNMSADPVPEGGSGKWTVLEGTGNFDDDTDNNTRVTSLSKGLNRYLWSITIGACTLEDYVDIYVNEGLIIPEGFSPNGDPDNYNNTFIIKGLDPASQEAELKIINGAGVEVFSTSNLNGNEWTSWDGTNRQGTPLAEGTYYYLLKIMSKPTGKVFRKSGFIILKRY